MSSTHHYRLYLIVAICGTLATACGKDGKEPKIVKDVNLRTFEQDGDTRAEVNTTLATGNIQLPAFEYEMPNPNNPADSFGRVSMVPDLNGGAELIVDANLSAIARAQDLPGLDPTLPNGAAIPVGGLGDSQVVGFPVGGDGIHAYLALGERVLLMGAAIPIAELDKLGGKIGNVNLFPTFTIRGVRGVAGIFTGAGEGQSGIALFVDAGQLLPEAQALMVQNGQMQETFGPNVRVAFESTEAAGLSTVEAQASSPLVFVNIRPTKKQREKIQDRLLDMHLDGKKTHVKKDRKKKKGKKKKKK